MPNHLQRVLFREDRNLWPTKVVWDEQSQDKLKPGIASLNPETTEAKAERMVRDLKEEKKLLERMADKSERERARLHDITTILTKWESDKVAIIAAWRADRTQALYPAIQEKKQFIFDLENVHKKPESSLLAGTSNPKVEKGGEIQGTKRVVNVYKGSKLNVRYANETKAGTLEAGTEIELDLSGPLSRKPMKTVGNRQFVMIKRPSGFVQTKKAPGGDGAQLWVAEDFLVGRKEQAKKITQIPKRHLDKKSDVVSPEVATAIEAVKKNKESDAGGKSKYLHHEKNANGGYDVYFEHGDKSGKYKVTIAPKGSIDWAAKTVTDEEDQKTNEIVYKAPKIDFTKTIDEVKKNKVGTGSKYLHHEKNATGGYDVYFEHQDGKGKYKVTVNAKGAIDWAAKTVTVEEDQKTNEIVYKAPKIDFTKTIDEVKKNKVGTGSKYLHQEKNATGGYDVYFEHQDGKGKYKVTIDPKGNIDWTAKTVTDEEDYRLNIRTYGESFVRKALDSASPPRTPDVRRIEINDGKVTVVLNNNQSVELGDKDLRIRLNAALDAREITRKPVETARDLSTPEKRLADAKDRIKKYDGIYLGKQDAGSGKYEYIFLARKIGPQASYVVHTYQYTGATRPDESTQSYTKSPDLIAFLQRQGMNPVTTGDRTEVVLPDKRTLSWEGSDEMKNLKVRDASADAQKNQALETQKGTLVTSLKYSVAEIDKVLKAYHAKNPAAANAERGKATTYDRLSLSYEQYGSWLTELGGNVDAAKVSKIDTDYKASHGYVTGFMKELPKTSPTATPQAPAPKPTIAEIKGNAMNKNAAVDAVNKNKGTILDEAKNDIKNIKDAASIRKVLSVSYSAKGGTMIKVEYTTIKEQTEEGAIRLDASNPFGLKDNETATTGPLVDALNENLVPK